MLNEFWESAPPAYKFAVFGGMALTMIGIVMVVIGAITGNPAFTFAAFPVIGVGLIAHMTSMVLRGRSISKTLKQKQDN